MQIFEHLSLGLGNAALVDATSDAPDEATVIEFSDLQEAEGVLARIARDDYSLQALRRAYDLLPIGVRHGSVSDDMAVQGIANALMSGYVRLFRLPDYQPSATPEDPTDVAPPAVVASSNTGTLQLKFVEDLSDQPVKGIKVKITLADDSERTAESNSDGLIEISDLKPGNIRMQSIMDDLAFDNIWAFIKEGVTPSSGTAATSDSGSSEDTSKRTKLASLSSYRVKTGDKLDAIAAGAGLTVEQLVQFNWGASGAQDIQDFLFIFVGCRTKDGAGKYVLDDDARPGTLYVPGKITRTWLPLDTLHYLRVAVPFGFRFVFSS